ncbi:hypothetical protein BDV33DRAFT_173846 [Aspergillus novoparasiticus]|uniref:Uncharacterized protein n=1 Tax=Aspergillus novoparasiticus TaxID=986946 RepID=A0A5N6EPZ5_9EURO|nr:hypothetical protein BDV33DRAFT_173846 [Aspergillus novoparasiticus]
MPALRSQTSDIKQKRQNSPRQRQKRNLQPKPRNLSSVQRVRSPSNAVLRSKSYVPTVIAIPACPNCLRAPSTAVAISGRQDAVSRRSRFGSPVRA